MRGRIALLCAVAELSVAGANLAIYAVERTASLTPTATPTRARRRSGYPSALPSPAGSSPPTLSPPTLSPGARRSARSLVRSWGRCCGSDSLPSYSSCLGCPPSRRKAPSPRRGSTFVSAQSWRPSSASLRLASATRSRSRSRRDAESGCLILLELRTLHLPQHAHEHRPERPILLAVDQELGEGAALRWPQNSPIRSLKVGSIRTWSSSAQSRAEGI